MKKLCVGVQVKTHPNPEIWTCHSRCRLIEDRQETEIEGFEEGYISGHNKDVVGVRPLTKAIVTQLRAVKGVKEVSVWPHQVTIQKSPEYSWGKLTPAIKKIFATYIPVEYF